ncbi:MAG: hypothetical protein GQ569_03055, partial [Methylococcaceae bacterium]|nr:hypothetical protein [Methylococcaceae bacterium]
GLHPDFVTFYADCYHEVKPITSGYRICLIYNLAIANRKKQPLLSDQSNTSQQVDNFVQQWVTEKQTNPTLTYLLEHSYSEENLCLGNLKNGDFAKASVLLNAAEKNGCQAFLCLVTYYRNSYGSTPYHGRYSYDEEVDESDFEECDVSDEEIYAHAFITSKGEKITIKKLHLDEDELLANIPLLDGESKCSISEATGNEGATKELWYHRGAVIIWTMERQLETINKMDIDYKLYFFKKFIQEQDLSVGNHRQQIISLASNIIEQQIQHDTTDISQELIAIGDIELLKKFVHKKIKSRFYSTLINIDNEIFINIAESCGWQHFEHELDEYLTPEYNAIEWLSSLLLIKGLSDKGKTIIKKWLTNLWKPSLEHKLTQEKIENVLYSVALLKLNTIGEELFEFLSLKTPSLTQTYVPAILNVVDKLKGQDYDSLIMTKFIEDACQKLQVGFPSAPVEASDFSRDGSLKCTCKFCAQINQFLPNPEQSDARISKTLKRNLIHIGDEIQKSGVDLEIIISRSPPKFEGLCKKNQKSYERKLSLFNGVQTMIKALQRS